jgi:hypothetical protein
MIINKIHYHTKDKGRHLSPCVKKRCDGLEPSPNSPIVEITKHQVEHLHDPLAKQSRKVVLHSNLNKGLGDEVRVVGDGDVWVEVLCKNVKTGQIKSYFKSTKNPQNRVPDEPPTGASHVVFLRSSYIEKYIK